MNEELNEMPTLTFDPVEAVAEPTPPAAEPKPAEPLDESALTVQERQMVEEFAKKIELTNSNAILQYGAGAQKKIADFSETALENVRTKDLGERCV